MSNQKSIKPRDNPARDDRDSGRSRFAELIPPNDASVSGFFFFRSLVAHSLLLLGLGIGLGMGPQGVESLRRLLVVLPLILAGLLAGGFPNRSSLIVSAVLTAALVTLAQVDSSAAMTPILALGALAILGLMTKGPHVLDRHLIRAGQCLLLLSFAAHSLDWLWYAFENLAWASSLLVPMSAEWGGLFPALLILLLVWLRQLQSFRWAFVWQGLGLSAVAILSVQMAAFALSLDGRAIPKASFDLAALRSLGLIGLIAVLPLIHWRGSAGPGSRTTRRPAGPIVAIALLLALTPLIGFVSEKKGGGLEGARILVCDFGSAIHNFDRPVPERVGLARAGLYGLMELSLERAGAQLRRCRDWPGQRELENIDVVLMMVPDKAPSATEAELLTEFVRAGGGLLYAGDHTDLLGSMEPANSILRPWGIEFQFDTAVESHSALSGDLFVRDIGVLSRDLRAVDLQILHGASLRCQKPARPLVVGRSTVSDHGDRSKPKKDAFLGDYAFQLGHEELGGQVLAAAVEVGSGRVVAFGDSSTFQNLAIPRSRSALLEISTYLRGRTTNWPIASLLAIVALVIFLSGGLGLGHGSWTAASTLVALALALLALPALLSKLMDVDRSLPTGTSGLVLVHGGDVPFLDRASFKARSITGLLLMSERFGLETAALDLNDCMDLDAAEIIVLAAPTGALSTNLMDRLDAFLRRGGTLIISSGFEERLATSALLERYKLRVSGRPLGAAPVMNLEAAREYSGPRFVSAWPIDRDEIWDKDEILFETDGEVVALARKVGSGRLVVLGDSEFFIDRNFEDERQRNDANVDLWLQMIGRGSIKEEKGR